MKHISRLSLILLISIVVHAVYGTSIADDERAERGGAERGGAERGGAAENKHCSTLKCDGTGGSYDPPLGWMPWSVSKCFGLSPEDQKRWYNVFADYYDKKNTTFPLKCAEGYEVHELLCSSWNRRMPVFLL